MPLLLVLAFIVVPLLELWVIGAVADVLTWPITLPLLVLDSVLGAVLVRREGSRAWHQLTDAIKAGRVPGDELVQGAMLLFGGALLLTPGFLTDGLGLALVLPFTRAPLARLVRHRVVPVQVQAGASAWNRTRPSPAGEDAPSGDGPGVVEVLSVERDDEQAPDA